MNHADLLTLIIGGFVTYSISFVGFCTWLVKKINAHDVALAVLLNTVNPPGEKSIRQLVTDVLVQQNKGQ